MDDTIVERIRQKYRALPHMDERMRRQWAGAEAAALGWGGLTAVSKATGLAMNTVRAGRAELKAARGRKPRSVDTRIRRPGGGRKPITQTDPRLSALLLELVDPATRGHPESPRRFLPWRTKHGPS